MALEGYLSNLLFQGRGEAERREVDVPQPPPPQRQPQSPPFRGGAGGASAAGFFSNGAGGNARRRAMEVLTMAPPPQQPALQPQPELSGLAQLHRPSTSSSPPRGGIVTAGLRLAPEEHLEHLDACLGLPPLCGPSLISDELACLIKQHDDEIDRLVLDQGEQLQMAFSERRQRLERALLQAVDEATSRQISELAMIAALQSAEQEEQIRHLQDELRVWQSNALAQHAAAAALHAQLQEATAANASGKELAGGVGPRSAETHSVCRACGRAPATVLLYPCRHLCLCSGCLAAAAAGEAASACPVCGCARTASVQAILS